MAANNHLVPVNRLFYLALFAVWFGPALALACIWNMSETWNPARCVYFNGWPFVAVMLISVLAAIHNPRNFMRPVYPALLLIAGLIGAGIAARQIWLQRLPPELAPECGPGLEYMLEVFPFMEALQMILSGSGECAEVQWTFLGFSIPEWSLAWFVIIVIAALVAAFRFRAD